MKTGNLTAYLQEHAAGASAALDLLDHLISSHDAAADEDFFEELQALVQKDKETLDQILGRFEAGESVLLNAMTRVGEKLARVKFLFAGPGHGDLGRLEAIEMLSLGLEGKRSLWLALHAAGLPALDDFDFPAMAAEAAQQREGVETRRLKAARHALATGA